MTTYCTILACIAAFLLSPQAARSQIPVVCSDNESLQNMECCPDNCNQDKGHGRCTSIQLQSTYNMTSSRVRDNWPHYYNRVCVCMGNYSGYDCSRCKYGHYGTNCNEKQILPRKSIQEFSYDEWVDYINTLKMTRMHKSGYKIVLSESLSGSANIPMSDEVNLYTLFVWQHHYAAKDNGKSVLCLFVVYSSPLT